MGTMITTSQKEVQVRITALPYNEDSAELFSHIAHREHAIFLDSAHPHYANTRFDIISAEPKTLLITKNGANTIIENQQQTPSNEDPFTLSKKILQSMQIDLPTTLPKLPFTIGAIGYYGYDIGRQLETIPNIAENDIQLPETVVGFYDWSIVVDHYDRKTWLITSKPQQIEMITAWLNETVHYPAFKLTTKFTSNMPLPRYEKSFNQLKQHILDGDCYEANLCQRFSANYQGNTWPAYEKLRQKSPAPYSAYFNLGQSSLLCFSPERFIEVRDGKCETKPIKGTQPRSDDPTQDQHNAYALLNSEKDKAENLMIVDLLRNDFGKCCIPGSIHVPKLFALESFRNVHHLVSTVIGTLEPKQHAFDLLKHCFPGGSITGAPKISAMKIIEQLEPHRRSAYCGTIGYADIRGQMDSNITIRTMLCDNNNIHCYAGGAIVSDSICEDEYQESLDKVNNLLKALSGSQTIC